MDDWRYDRNEDDQRPNYRSQFSSSGQVMETEETSESQDSCNFQDGSSSSENEEEDDRGTVIETSYEEASLNHSTYSDKCNDSSSELSVDPVMWKKFKFLSSILKETQHNLRAMDDLIFEHQRVCNQPQVQCLHSLPSPVSQLPQHLNQGLGDGEPKTDEAKLEEILSLLHHLTNTLSSYEQHPLLASAARPVVGDLRDQTLHLSSMHHWQDNKKMHTRSMSDPQSLSIPPQDHSIPSCSSVRPHSGIPQLIQSKVENENSKYFDFCEDNVNDSSTVRVHGGIAYAVQTNTVPHISSIDMDEDLPNHNTSPHFRTQENQHHENSIDASHVFMSNASGKAEHNGGDFSQGCKKDRINQTDSLLLWPRTNKEQNEDYVEHPSSSRLDNGHIQDAPQHPLMKETRSLRKEIDDIVVRKQALDLKLQSLIAHRQREKELNHSPVTKKKHKLGRSKSLEDVEQHRLRTRKKKYKTRSKSYEEQDHERNSKRKDKVREVNVRDAYLSMISEDQGSEFPSLTMESSDNGDRILELRSDEAELPGLGDSGLSSEINSINATIQELVKENQQLHKYLQGMTCESILKVDKEKLALEAQIQTLNEENQTLKTGLQEECIGEDATSPQKSAKGVKFCLKMNENKDMTKCKDEMETESVLKEKPTSTSTIENEEEESSYIDHLTDESYNEAYLKDEIARLTQHNQNLLKIIEENQNKEEKTKLSEKEEEMSSINNEISKNNNLSKQLAKLREYNKKLVEDNEKLRDKLSEEACERDVESARLEARIQILSKQNQNLHQKMGEEKSSLKTGKSENNQIELASHDADIHMSTNSFTQTTESADADGNAKESSRDSALVPRVDSDSTVLVDRQAELITREAISDEYKFGYTINTGISHPSKGFGNYDKNKKASAANDDVEFKVSGSSSSMSLEDEGDKSKQQLSLSSTVYEKAKNSEKHKVSNRETELNSKLTQQLEELLKQTKTIATGLNDMKSSSETSQSVLESNVLSVMERHFGLVENIGEKLSALVSSGSIPSNFEQIQIPKENININGVSEELETESLMKHNLVNEKQQGMEGKGHDYQKVNGISDNGIMQNSNHIPKLNHVPYEKFEKDGAQECIEDCEVETERCSNVQERNGEGLLKQALEKEKENWMQLLKQADKEKVMLQERIKNLVEENDCLAGRLEEAMGVSRGRLEGVRQQLAKAEEERDQLEYHIKSLEEEKENCSVSVSESLGSSHLSQKLKERIQTLRVEVEQAWEEVHKQRLEKNQVVAQKESFERTTAIAMTTHKKEVDTLRTQIEALETERKEKTRELDRLCSELQENSSALRGTKAENVEKQEQANKKIAALQEELRLIKEELSKEKEERIKEREELELEKKREKEDYQRRWEERRKEMEELQMELKNERGELLKEWKREREELDMERKKDLEALERELEEKKKHIHELENGKEGKMEKDKSKNLEYGSAWENRIDEDRSVRERRWAETVARLKGEVHQEQLRARLLEAADQESSAHILLLQRSIRELTNSQDKLQAKYDNLRSAYRAKKMERGRLRELSLQYTTQVQELDRTSTALEENLKGMLYALGENVDVAVDILASHVFLAPCMVHPGPDFNSSPSEWFATQKTRLKWLQTQLRKLCLHSWKTGELPKTSHLGFSDTPGVTRKLNFSEDHTRSPDTKPKPLTGTRVTRLCDLTIVDESIDYSGEARYRRGSMSHGSTPLASPSKSIIEAKKKGSANLKKLNGHLQNEKESFLAENKNEVSSVKLSEAEKLLTKKQRELSEARYKQYKALIQSLQRDLDLSMAPSPSVPSSILTTPEKISSSFQTKMKKLNTEPSSESDISLSETQLSQIESPLKPSLESQVSFGSGSHSVIRAEICIVDKTEIRSESPSQEAHPMNKVENYDDFKNISPEKSSVPDIETSKKERMAYHTSGCYEMLLQKKVSEENLSKNIDVDKDHDSFGDNDNGYQNTEDIIRVFVHSET